MERKHYEKTREKFNVLQSKFDSYTKSYQELQMQFDFLDKDHKSNTAMCHTFEFRLSEEKQKNEILEEENKKLRDEVSQMVHLYCSVI